MLASNYAICGKKKVHLKPRRSRLLSKLRIKTLLSNILLIGDIFSQDRSFVLIMFELINLK